MKELVVMWLSCTVGESGEGQSWRAGGGRSVEVSLFVSGLSLSLKHMYVVVGGKQAEGGACYG